MIIDCGTCAVAGLACDDCVVSVLLGPPPSISSETPEMIRFSDAIVADPAPDAASAEVVSLPVTTVADEHAPAIAVLAEAGLIPPLRLVPRSEAS